MKVTIVGSGVIGLTAAYYIKKKKSNVEVTVVARDMPPAAENTNPEDVVQESWTQGQWASPFAGAIFYPTETSDRDERAMQIESYRHFWSLAHSDPTAGIEVRLMRQYFDDTSGHSEMVWAHHTMQKFRHLDASELPTTRRGITSGVEYLGLCINPVRYLPWLRGQLELIGVGFEQRAIDSFAQLDSDVIVNATGLGAGPLANDPLVEPVRGQTVWVRSTYQGPMAMRTGKEYTYVIPRSTSGGVIIGGFSSNDSIREVSEKVRQDIMQRVGDLLPEVVVPDHGDDHGRTLSVIKDISALRPSRKHGFRIEPEGRIVHAYGFGGNGYIFSAGAAARIAALVLSPSSSKL